MMHPVVLLLWIGNSWWILSISVGKTFPVCTKSYRPSHWWVRALTVVHNEYWTGLGFFFMHIYAFKIDLLADYYVDVYVSMWMILNRKFSHKRIFKSLLFHIYTLVHADTNAPATHAYAYTHAHTYIHVHVHTCVHIHTRMHTWLILFV